MTIETTTEPKRGIRQELLARIHGLLDSFSVLQLYKLTELLDQDGVDPQEALDALDDTSA